MSLLRPIFSSARRLYPGLLCVSRQECQHAGLKTSVLLRVSDDHVTSETGTTTTPPDSQLHVEAADVDTDDMMLDYSSMNILAPSKPLEKRVHDKKKSVEIEPDYRPGAYIPTEDTYGALYGGQRWDELTCVYFKLTKNNTKGSACTPDHSKTLAGCTAGGLGFKNAKKGTNVAAQAVGLGIGRELFSQKVNFVRVHLSGTNNGLSPIKGLQLAGINIASITDRTYPNMIQRPKKPRRV